MLSLVFPVNLDMFTVGHIGCIGIYCIMVKWMECPGSSWGTTLLSNGKQSTESFHDSIFLPIKTEAMTAYYHWGFVRTK